MSQSSTLSAEYEDYWEKLKGSARFHPANRLRYFLIFKELKKFIKPEMRVLDMGCGDAELLKVIESKWPQNSYFGCDISSLVVELNQKRVKKIQFFAADLGKPDFIETAKSVGANSCEMIVSSEVIEHVPDDLQFIKNAYNCLAPGGYFLLTTQSGPRYRIDHELLHHLRHYERANLEKMIENSGLTILKSYSCGFPILNLQKIIANMFFDQVFKATASSKEPSFLVKCIMSLMYYGMRSVPHFFGGPQLVVIAQKPA